MQQHKILSKICPDNVYIILLNIFVFLLNI